jgi:hypothetical protein
MWLFLTRKLRAWLILTILVPIGGGLLRRAGQELQRRRGPSAVSNTLIRAGDLTDRVRRRNRGRRR